MQTEVVMDPNQQAIVKQYGFKVTRDNDGRYHVEDPQAVKLSIPAGSHSGTDFAEALRSAVRMRKVYDPDNKANAVDGSKVEPKKKTRSHPAASTSAPPQPPVKGKTQPVVSPPTPSTAQPEPKSETKERVTLPEEPKKPATEVVDVELDNTGKREGKSKREIVRKENRFIRTMRVLVKKPDISPDDLSKEAGISTPREAGYYIDFYLGVTQALKEVGIKELPERRGSWITLKH